MDEFMDRAVKLAAINVQEGGEPFGAVLVKNGDIIEEGVNELHRIHDVSGHAEMVVIRRAQKKMETDDLSEYTLYASGEPCPMCLSAMYYAGIKDAYFCQSQEEATAAGIGGTFNLYDELKKENEDRKLSMNHMPLEATQLNPTKLWQKQQEMKNEY